MTSKDILLREWKAYKGITIVIVVFLIGIIKFAYVG
jgi:hypothetical protein